MRFLIVIVAALIGVPASLAAAPALPFDPAALHGFNLMEKVAVDWMNAPYQEEDFALIKEFGFNYVRVPVDYRCYTVKNEWLSFREDVLRDFDQAIAWGEKYGLHVTLALHRAPGYCVNPPPEAKDLWSDDEALAAFTAHWEMFARRYQSVPASRLSFNLVNEPGGTTPDNVVRVYRHVVAAIHRVTPDRVVFLDGVDGGGKTLPELASLPNVVQSGRGYFSPVTFYRASWRDVSREFMPTPSWPVRPAFNAFLYGPFWEKDGLNQPLVLRGSFPAQTLLDVRVLIVSTSATLVVKADGKPVFEKRFEPKDGLSKTIALGERVFFLNNGVTGQDPQQPTVYTGFLMPQAGCIYCVRGTRQQSSWGIRDALGSAFMGINEPSMLVNSANSSSSRVFSSYHRGGAQFTMADGSVRFLSESTGLAILRDLISIADGRSTTAE